MIETLENKNFTHKVNSDKKIFMFLQKESDKVYNIMTEQQYCKADKVISRTYVVFAGNNYDIAKEKFNYISFKYSEKKGFKVTI